MLVFCPQCVLTAEISHFFLSFIPIYFSESGGVTSSWFCLESTALTLAITATAFSFYRHQTTQNARRMFHASLLYLPVFMSGILLHRLSDEQTIAEDNLDSTLDFSSSQEILNVDRKNKSKRSRPPVAYASAAPFPFLPAPSYVAY